MPTVKLNLSHMSDSEKLALCEEHIAALQGRANFPMALPETPLRTGWWPAPTRHDHGSDEWQMTGDELKPIAHHTALITQH